MTKKQYWLLPGTFYVLATILDLLGRLWFPPVHDLVKPALLPLLAATTIAAAGGLDSRLVRLLLFAQVFGCAGDIMLLYPGNFWFIVGIGSFFIGHIFYLIIFGEKAWKGMSVWTWLISAVVILSMLLVLSVAIGIKGVMLVPMCTYGIMLLLLIFCGVAGIFRLGGTTWWIMLSGAVLFTFSDSMIAVKEFAPDLNTPFMGFVIMLTYLSAQALLAWAALRLAKKEMK